MIRDKHFKYWERKSSFQSSPFSGGISLVKLKMHSFKMNAAWVQIVLFHYTPEWPTPSFSYFKSQDTIQADTTEMAPRQHTLLSAMFLKVQPNSRAYSAEWKRLLVKTFVSISKCIHCFVIIFCTNKWRFFVRYISSLHNNVSGPYHLCFQ